MSCKNEIEHFEALKAVSTYIPETGQVIWSVKGRGRNLNQEAGYVNKHGYRVIGAGEGSKLIRCHRYIYWLETGKAPRIVDHKNGELINGAKDNRFSNLREANSSQNSHNAYASKNNKLGVKGVCFRRGKYVAQIQKDRKVIYLGRFKTIEEAKRAYDKASIELYGEFSKSAREAK